MKLLNYYNLIIILYNDFEILKIYMIFIFHRMCIVAFAVVSLDYASQAAINPCEA